MSFGSYLDENEFDENVHVDGDLDFEDPDLFSNVDLSRVSSSTYTLEESISKGLPDFGNGFNGNVWGYPTEDSLSMVATVHNQKTALGLSKPNLSRNKSLESSVKSALQDMKGEKKTKKNMNVPCKPYLLTKFYFYTDEVDEMRIKEDIEEYFDEECRISYQFNGKEASWTCILYESNGPAFTNMTVNLYRSDNPLYSFIIECNRENGDYPLFKHFVWRMTGLSLVVSETIPKVFLKNKNNNSATSTIAPAVSNGGRSSSIGSNNTALNIQPRNVSISNRIGEDSTSTLSRESMLESLELVYSLAMSPFLESKMEASAILVTMSTDIHNENYLFEKNMLEAMFHLSQSSFTLDNGKEVDMPMPVRGNAILTLSNLSINLAKQETLLDRGITSVLREMLFSMSQAASTASGTHALEIKDLQRESLRILTNLSKRYSDRVLQELGNTVLQEWIECVDGYEKRDPIMCMHAKMAREAITMGLNTAIAT